MRSNSGQALLEFAVCFPIVIVVLIGAALLIRTEWNRDRCAYQVFLAAHAALRGRPQSRLVQIELTESGVTAQGRCGDARESVRLPYLEKARW